MKTLLLWGRYAAALASGLAVTLKYLFKPAVTLQFPDQRRTLPKSFRGLLHNDVSRCITCTLCAEACPVDCIAIDRYRNEKNKFMMTKFDIDMVKCIYCGLCTEVCPTECLTMSGGYETVPDRRTELILRFVPAGQAVPAFDMAKGGAK